MYCLLCRIHLVIMWFHHLQVAFLFGENHVDEFCCLVIHDVHFRLVSFCFQHFEYLLVSLINAMVVNICNGFNQYCIKLIMVQDKEADTAIYQPEGEISGEVIVDDTADFIGEGAKTKYIRNPFVFQDDVDTFQPCIGSRFFIIL